MDCRLWWESKGEQGRGSQEMTLDQKRAMEWVGRCQMQDIILKEKQQDQLMDGMGDIKQRGVRADSKGRCHVGSWIYEAGVQGRSREDPGRR